ncbi:basic salivary proline-rich protein 1-like [Huso huso]|uniref:Basic salivary proline-rich protein 1-like n=1 Tax=Huso huso TaxID=61971 RepID=A0ABR1A7U0_HUSHU
MHLTSSETLKSDRHRAISEVTASETGNLVRLQHTNRGVLMKMKTSIIFACLLGASFAVPVYHQRYGLSASNSNEFMRHSGNAYNGVGYGQPQVPYMPPYVYQQQQPDMGLPSQLPLNPQVAGGAGQGPMQPQGPLPPQVLLPPQSPLPPQVLFPPSQKDQSPNAPQQPLTLPCFFNPKMLPSYYPSVVFPQQTGGQGMPYYISYGYPQPNQPAVWQPTQEQAQQHLEQPTQTSQQPMQGFRFRPYPPPFYPSIPSYPSIPFNPSNPSQGNDLIFTYSP